MQKVKKLTALVLAMMMALSIMAVTASAYGAEEHEHVCSEETIQPRMPAAECLTCRESMVPIQTTSENGRLYTILQCQNRACSNYGYTEKIYW